MSCKAKLTSIVRNRGKESVEWHKDGAPQYYCMGYIDNRTEELLPVCRECRENVIYAQEDFEEYQSNKLKESEVAE